MSREGSHRTCARRSDTPLAFDRHVGSIGARRPAAAGSRPAGLLESLRSTPSRRRVIRAWTSACAASRMRTSSTLPMRAARISGVSASSRCRTFTLAPRRTSAAAIAGSRTSRSTASPNVSRAFGLAPWRTDALERGDVVVLDGADRMSARLTILGLGGRSVSRSCRTPRPSIAWLTAKNVSPSTACDRAVATIVRRTFAGVPGQRRLSVAPLGTRARFSAS